MVGTLRETPGACDWAVSDRSVVAGAVCNSRRRQPVERVQAPRFLPPHRVRPLPNAKNNVFHFVETSIRDGGARAPHLKRDLVVPLRKAPCCLCELPASIDLSHSSGSDEFFDNHISPFRDCKVAKLNELTSGTPLEKKSIEELIRTRAKIPTGVFNSAAQTWNHDFYWKVRVDGDLWSLSSKGLPDCEAA